MPFPSAGCQTCKIRRIKCDEAQPVCQKCVKSQRTCQRVGDGQIASVIHIENAFASGLKKRPRGPRSSPTKGLTSNICTSLKRTSFDLNTYALTYYAHYHLQTVADSPNIILGISDDILPMWKLQKQHPIFDLAVSSMALAVFSQAQHDSQAAIEASIKYQKLLQTAQATISKLDGENIVACLLAIWFMGRYEHAEHRLSQLDPRMPLASQLRSFKHHDGAMAILKTWKDSLSHKQPVTNVIKHSRRGLIKSALLRYQAIPEWMLKGTSFNESGLDLEYDCIVVQLANFRQRLSTFVTEDDKPKSTSHNIISMVEKFNNEARDLDHALEGWASRIPTEWSSHQHELPGGQLWSTPEFYSPVLYTYPSLAHAAVWNQYFATRMLVNNTRLKVLDLYPPDMNESIKTQRINILCILDNIANHLASSIPFCLQRINITQESDSSTQSPSIILTPNSDLKPYVASMVVWPLSIASGLRYLDGSQQIWFRSQLARLGRLVGAPSFECADTNHWLEL